jgi:fatty acid desaturase
MHFVRLGLGTVLYVFAIPVVSLRHAPAADRRAILAEYALLSILIPAVLCLVSPGKILAVWGAPFLLANWMINIRGFSQHGIAEASDPWLASRSTVPHPLVRFFLINENFHLEHHLFPGVPGYRLAELHVLLRPHIPRRLLCRSYASFLAAFLRQAPRMDEHPIGLTFQSVQGRDGGRCL